MFNLWFLLYGMNLEAFQCYTLELKTCEVTNLTPTQEIAIVEVFSHFDKV